MAVVTFTNLATGGVSLGGPVTTRDTASVLISTTKLTLIVVGIDNGGTAAPTISLSGGGLTYTLIKTQVDVSGGTRRISIFRVIATSPTTTAITMTFSTNIQEIKYSIIEVGNVDVAGGTDANAVVQSASNGNTGPATTLTATLGAFANSNNATLGAIFLNGTTSVTPGSGFTELVDDSTNGTKTLEVEYNTGNDTSVDWSWGTSQAVCGVAIELKFAEVKTGGAGIFPVFM